MENGLLFNFDETLQNRFDLANVKQILANQDRDLSVVDETNNESLHPKLRQVRTYKVDICLEIFYFKLISAIP